MGLLSGLRGGSSDNTNCTAINTFEAQPVVGTWGLQKLFTVVGGALAAATLLISLGLTMMHLINYSNPPLQRQLIRAILMPAIYVIFAFLGVAFYNESRYLIPVGDFYQCFSLVALFYYMNLVFMPSAPKRSLSFYGGDIAALQQVVPGGDLTKYSKTWVAVFQILPGRILLTIIQWIVDGVYCVTSTKLRTATTIINVLNGIQTAVCVMAILRFYKLVKPQLQGHKIVLKLIAFKLPIAIQILQKAIFSGLNNHNDLHVTSHISQADWWYGFPCFLTVCEMFIFIWFFIPAFTWRPFTRQYLGDSYQSKGSFFGGIIDVLNVSDIISGALFTLKLRSAVKSGAPLGAVQYEENPQPDMRYQQNDQDMRYQQNDQDMRYQQNDQETGYERTDRHKKNHHHHRTDGY